MRLIFAVFLKLYLWLSAQSALSVCHRTQGHRLDWFSLFLLNFIWDYLLNLRYLCAIERWGHRWDWFTLFFLNFICDYLLNLRYLCAIERWWRWWDWFTLFFLNFICDYLLNLRYLCAIERWGQNRMLMSLMRLIFAVPFKLYLGLSAQSALSVCHRTVMTK